MKDDIEAEMLLLQLTRTGIQDEKKRNFETIRGTFWKKSN